MLCYVINNRTGGRVKKGWCITRKNRHNIARNTPYVDMIRVPSIVVYYWVVDGSGEEQITWYAFLPGAWGKLLLVHTTEYIIGHIVAMS